MAGLLGLPLFPTLSAIGAINHNYEPDRRPVRRLLQFAYSIIVYPAEQNTLASLTVFSLRSLGIRFAQFVASLLGLRPRKISLRALTRVHFGPLGSFGAASRTRLARDAPLYALANCVRSQQPEHARLRGSPLKGRFQLVLNLDLTLIFPRKHTNVLKG